MTAPHQHTRPPLQPVDAAHYGLPGTTIDLDNAAALLGAAIAGCRPCQDIGLDTISHGDPLAAAHLIGAAYAAITFVHAEVLGTRDHDPGSDTHYAPPTRSVFTAMRTDGPAAAAEAVQVLGPAARRAALDDALDLLVGMTHTHLVVLEPGR